MAATPKYGVFLWREDGRYRASLAVKKFVREGAAQADADKRNETYTGEYGGYVVRTLEHLPNTPTHVGDGPSIVVGDDITWGKGIIPGESSNVSKVEAEAITRQIGKTPPRYGYDLFLGHDDVYYYWIRAVGASARRVEYLIQRIERV